MDLLANERYSRILSLLKQNGAVTTGELVELLGVSLETVRRDLLHLERQGQLKRVHGGAVSPGSMRPYVSLPERLEANPDKKTQLCRTAALLIEEGDVICIDCGSTAVFLAQAIRDRISRLTVITHSLDVFDILRQKEGFQIILLGGTYDDREKAFWGHLTLDTLEHLHAQKAFLCPSAVSLERGIWDYHPQLLQLQKKIITSADRAVILADSEKFESTAMLKLWDTDPGFLYVSDPALPQHLRQLYREQGIHIITSAQEAETVRKEIGL